MRKQKRDKKTKVKLRILLDAAIEEKRGEVLLTFPNIQNVEEWEVWIDEN